MSFVFIHDAQAWSLPLFRTEAVGVLLLHSIRSSNIYDFYYDGGDGRFKSQGPTQMGAR